MYPSKEKMMADMNGLNGQRVQTNTGIEQKTQSNRGRDTRIENNWDYKNHCCKKLQYFDINSKLTYTLWFQTNRKPMLISNITTVRYTLIL